MIHHGIRANGKHSYMDFDLFLRSRQIGVPEKKSVRQSVPYMSGFYDFSAINGEPAWGERHRQHARGSRDPARQDTRVALQYP